MYENKTVDFLNGLAQFGWRLGLENISRLLTVCGDPHRRFKSIHIAGTNGKGTTAAILESIFRQAGYRTGLYTSPHLLNVTERIRIDSKPILLTELCSQLERIKREIRALGGTYFEALTAVAFQCFAEAEVDLAFVEVGLGGRLDATNVVRPLLSIITDIELDHTEHLGRSKAKIAEEKGGIIKAGVACLSGVEDFGANSILERIAKDRNAPFFRLTDGCSVETKAITANYSEFSLKLSDDRIDNVRLNLVGGHQIKNASLAVRAAEMLRTENFNVASQDIVRGLREVHWPGRIEQIHDSPVVVVDVAHNPAAVQALVSALRSLYKFQRLIFVIGLLKDKNYEAIAELIATAGDFVFIVEPNSDRGLSTSVLAREFSRHTTRFKTAASAVDGFEQATSFAQPDDLICVMGSHHVVGECLEFHKNA